MKFSYRTTGLSAIGSGIFGILAIGSLVGSLVMRNTSEVEEIFIGRFHDAFAIFQFVFMIPVAFGLYKLSQKTSAGISKSIFNFGIAAMSFTAISLLLIFPKITTGIFYMFPQGVFGIWLMIVNWRIKQIVHPALRWFGIIVGLGLAFVGVFVIGFAIFVNADAITIPAPPMKYYPETPANLFLHQILYIGSFMGVFTLPVWTILTGRWLLRKRLVD
ncbi:MAG: hypothetical protein ABI685_01800 [Ferruginibacter sp.]